MQLMILNHIYQPLPSGMKAADKIRLSTPMLFVINGIFDFIIGGIIPTEDQTLNLEDDAPIPVQIMASVMPDQLHQKYNCMGASSSKFRVWSSVGIILLNSIIPCSYSVSNYRI